MARFSSKNFRNDSGEWEWAQMQKDWRRERVYHTILIFRPPVSALFGNQEEQLEQPTTNQI